MGDYRRDSQPSTDAQSSRHARFRSPSDHNPHHTSRRPSSPAPLAHPRTHKPRRDSPHDQRPAMKRARDSDPAYHEPRRHRHNGDSRAVAPSRRSKPILKTSKGADTPQRKAPMDLVLNPCGSLISLLSLICCILSASSPVTSSDDFYQHRLSEFRRNSKEQARGTLRRRRSS